MTARHFNYDRNASGEALATMQRDAAEQRKSLQWEYDYLSEDLECDEVADEHVPEAAAHLQYLGECCDEIDGFLAATGHTGCPLALNINDYALLLEGGAR
jgi:hypothetical protein